MNHDLPSRRTQDLLLQRLEASATPQSAQDLAQAVRLSRETVKKVLRVLAQQGAVLRVPASDPRYPANRHALTAHWVHAGLPPQPAPPRSAGLGAGVRRPVSDEALCTVFDALLDGPASVAMLIELTSLNPETLRQALRVMYSRGEVEVLDPLDARRPPLGPHARVWAVVRCRPAVQPAVAAVAAAATVPSVATAEVQP